MGINLLAGAAMLGLPVSRTFLAAVKHRKERERKEHFDPTDPSYKQTLKMMRQTLEFTSINTVEDIQHTTTGWVPHPPSVLVKDVVIPDSFYPKAAKLISENLGEENLERVGKTWWQWRKPGSVVRAEWIEMKSDYVERTREGNSGESKKVIFYVHGGAYFFGAIGHLPFIQRHARKLKGRVFAPRYRLAPQFPFPCAVQDVLSAYLYLLTIQDPSTIVVAGDSAGAGLCLSLLLILRDSGLPLPAGASLISAWVDLTHSFPSITIPTDLDYVPAHGFHAKPSLSWPPPNSSDIVALGLPVHKYTDPDLEVEYEGQILVLEEQVQMYAPNTWLQIPLVSGIMAASLGGLCPMQVICGGGEVLRDEQIYLAHKAASPTSYPPSAESLARNGQTMDDINKYPPTDVQLLIFDDTPHAASTLMHTEPAMFEYRAVSQFAAWALAKAQGVEHELGSANFNAIDGGFIGKAGDPLPKFIDHMIRLRVGHSGELYPIEPVEVLRSLNIPNEEIGVLKVKALKGWLEFRQKADIKFRAEREKVCKQRMKDAEIGYVRFADGEVPPVSALAGRLVLGKEVEAEKERGKISKRVFGGLFGKTYQERQDPVELKDFNGSP